MKPHSSILISGVSLAAGIGLAWLSTRVSPRGSVTSQEMSEPLRRPSELPSASAEEKDRQQLRQLSRDPFIVLSDEEIAALASRLDLRREENIRLLNSILHPGLRSRIWEACLRANVDRFSLPELCRLATSVRLTQDAGTTFDSVIERVIAERGQKTLFLGRDLKSPLLTSYVDYYCRRSFSEAVAQLSTVEAFTHHQLLETWLKHHPGVAGLSEILQPPSGEDDVRTRINYRWAIPKAWSGTPAKERQAFLDQLQQLPSARRGEILESIAFQSTWARHDPAELVQIMDSMTSFISQKYALEEFISGYSFGDVDPATVRSVIDQLDRAPNPARYEKIRKATEEFLQQAKEKTGE